MQLERIETITLLSLQKARQRSLIMVLKMASLHWLDILSERENSPVLWWSLKPFSLHVYISRLLYGWLTPYRLTLYREYTKQWLNELTDSLRRHRAPFTNSLCGATPNLLRLHVSQKSWATAKIKSRMSLFSSFHEKLVPRKLERTRYFILKFKNVAKFHVHISPVFSCRVTYTEQHLSH